MSEILFVSPLLSNMAFSSRLVELGPFLNFSLLI